MKFMIKNWWKLAIGFIAAGTLMFGIAFGLGSRGGSLSMDGNGIHLTSFSNGSGENNEMVVIDEKSLAEFSSIEVSGFSEKIHLVPSDHYGLEMRTTEENGLKWDVSGGKLTVKRNAQSGFQIDLINIDLGVFGDRYVTVYYPQGANFDDIKIDTSSGSVDVSGLTAKNISINVFSGDVNADVTLENGNVSIDTSSGDVKFKSAGNANKVGISAFSGNVSADVNDCTELQIGTSSGDITAKSSGQTETKLDISAFSGSITANGNTWRDLKSDTSSGDIDISGRLMGKSVVNAFSGDVKISVKGSPSEYGYNLESFSGRIRIDGNKLGKSAQSNVTGANTITVDTSSGDITINFTN